MLKKLALFYFLFAYQSAFATEHTELRFGSLDEAIEAALADSVLYQRFERLWNYGSQPSLTDNPDDSSISSSEEEDEGDSLTARRGRVFYRGFELGHDRDGSLRPFWA